MQSHLAVSYSSSTATSGSSGASASTSASAEVKTDSNPLGFLTALIDQIIGHGTTASGGDDANTEPGPSINNPAPGIGLLNVDVAVTTPDETKPVDGKSLLATLNEELDKLKSELDGGESPDPDLLKKLGQTINALMALLNPQTPQLQPPVLDPDPSATTGITGVADCNIAPTGGTPPSTERLPGLAELTAKIDALTKALAPLAPQAAQQLQDLSTKLNQSPDPQLLAQLNASLTTEPAAKTVPTTPQLAATQLAVPEAIVPKSTTTPDIATPLAPVDGVTTEPSAPTILPSAVKLAVATKDVTTGDDGQAKLDAKLAAAATAAVTDSKTDTAASTSVAANATATTAPAAAPRILPAAYQAVANPINMAQVAFEMVRQVHQGQSRFTIRIDPPELGRVDVKMHVDASGTVNAKLTVERSETLDMFQRDRSSLEKALSQAGLDAGKTNLEFSLKQQQNPFAGMAGGDHRQQSQTYGNAKYASADDDTSVAPVLTLYRGTASAAGVNLIV
jgi:flagellar hook-length control protein FliK